MRDVDEGCALVARLRREAVDQGQLGGARRATEGAAPDEGRPLVQAFPRFQRELRQRLGAALDEGSFSIASA